MNLFSNLDTKDVERSGDTLSTFSLLDSDIYEATIKTAYIGNSEGGAINITLLCDINGNEYKEVIYITDRNKLPYSITAQNKKRFLPGYKIMNDICIVTLGKELNDPSITQEQKIIKVFNFKERKELPTEVEVISDLTGKKLCLGIIKELRNKAIKNAEGKYVDTPETRESNTINTVFCIDSHKSAYEYYSNKDAEFYDKWLAANKGKIKDRRSIKDAATTSNAKSTKSLFGKDPTTSSNKEEEVETSTKLTNKLFKN